jgi:hypothetical protein
MQQQSVAWHDPATHSGGKCGWSVKWRTERQRGAHAQCLPLASHDSRCRACPGSSRPAHMPPTRAPGALPIAASHHGQPRVALPAVRPVQQPRHHSCAEGRAAQPSHSHNPRSDSRPVVDLLCCKATRKGWHWVRPRSASRIAAGTCKALPTALLMNSVCPEATTARRALGLNGRSSPHTNRAERQHYLCWWQLASGLQQTNYVWDRQDDVDAMCGSTYPRLQTEAIRAGTTTGWLTLTHTPRTSVLLTTPHSKDPGIRNIKLFVDKF